MNANVIMVVIGVVVLTINCTTMILTFPGKRSLPFTVGMLALFTIAFYTVLSLTGSIVPDDGGLPGLAYLPAIILLFKGNFFHKVFAYFLQFMFTTFQVTLAQTVGGAFAQYGENVSFSITVVTMIVLFTTYVVLMFKFGRRMFERLFVYGRPAEWALYSFGAIFAFAVLTTTQIASGSLWHITLMLFFILWSFAVLCFAIINANDKARHKYEAEFARNVISSGHEHYLKMNEMHEALRILRHDYKYHLDTVSELLDSGHQEEAGKYLTDIKNQLDEKNLPNFCSNAVLNALLASYAERCAKLAITYSTQISLPDNMTIPNYEMCIVLGNLLENAVEACGAQSGEISATESNKIELVVNTQDANLAVMVKNSFNGEIAQNNDRLLSKKKDGGLGLRSVQAVAARHGGELMTELEDNMFTAYVLMRV